MALYEYECAYCEEQFDLMRSMGSADAPAECPECGSGESRRLVSSFAAFVSGDPGSTATTAIDASRVGGGCCGGGACGCG